MWVRDNTVTQHQQHCQEWFTANTLSLVVTFEVKNMLKTYNIMYNRSLPLTQSNSSHCDNWHVCLSREWRDRLELWTCDVGDNMVLATPFDRTNHNNVKPWVYLPVFIPLQFELTHSQHCVHVYMSWLRAGLEAAHKKHCTALCNILWRRGITGIQKCLNST